MYEFVAAIAGRNIFYEGEVNQTSLMNGLIGTLFIQGVASYYNEMVEMYWFIFFKYGGAYFASTLLFGALTWLITLGKYRPDPFPRTRAWPNGPHLNPVFRVLRDAVCVYFSVFWPLTEQGKLIAQTLWEQQSGPILGVVGLVFCFYVYDEFTMSTQHLKRE